MPSPFSYKFYSSTSTAWQAMYRAVLGAYKSIYWEVYIFIDDETGQRFVDLLCQKAEQGVDVKIIIDGMGSFNFSQTAINKLRNSGVEVIVFNPIILKKWWKKIWLRTHCKVLLVDCETAFVGGVNVQHHMENWDDLHLRLSGKVIRPLLRYFAKKYMQAGGKRKNVKHILHPKLIRGYNLFKDKINYILHSPAYRYRRSPFSHFYHKSLKMAKKSITLLTPYYAPDRKFLELIYKARKRGVKVNIIMPYKSDMVLMQYMAKAFYKISKKAGATFYFLKKMNHGKALLVDDKVGMVGSANITPRSFFENHEANVTFTDEQMVGELNSILEFWKNQADPLLELDFKKQGWFKRFKNWCAMRLRDHV